MTKIPAPEAGKYEDPQGYSGKFGDLWGNRRFFHEIPQDFVYKHRKFRDFILKRIPDPQRLKGQFPAPKIPGNVGRERGITVHLLHLWLLFFSDF